MTDDSDDGLLRTGGAFNIFSDVAGSGDEAFLGRDLGDYRITGLIAEGGMSRVYRAERTDGSFEREVAIKVSPVSGFNDSMRERFLQEQGVLAGLNHPNISQLFDARLTEEGWPYIVMEHVDGGPVDRFCEENEKGINDRIRLLIDIVDAVAYAHARLVVHRDIKPSNVLVNEDGRPKLLDFGIAKLLEGDERDLTKAGPMTPRYASPEQLLGLQITTASDTYQLGLLFYEVLTGRSLNKDEALSTAIQRAADQKPLVIDAATRQALPRELVLIIEQCLRVSPNERYGDANSLRNDLQAFLDGYPVAAAGQSAGYRLRKFVGRNVPAVAIAIVAVLAIVGGSSWYTWQLSQARDLAEQRADTSSRLLQTMSQLVADTFSGLMDSNAERDVGDESYIESVLGETVALIDTELATEPEARAELLKVQGTIEMTLGNYDSSAAALDRAYSLVDPGASPELAIGILMDRLEVASRSMDFETARASLDEASSLVSKNEFGDDVMSHYWHQLGQASQAEGNYELAVEEFDKATQLLQLQTPVNTRLLASTYEEVAFTYTSWGRYPEAIVAAEEALGILGRTESSMSHRLINPLRFAGYGYLNTENTEKARAYYERALSIARANFGDVHPDVGAVQDSLGALAYKERRFEDAAAHFEEMIRIVTLLHGADSGNLIVPKVNSAVIYTDLGQFEKAGRYLGEILAATANGDPEHQQFRFVAVNNEARRRYALGDFERAAQLYEEKIAIASSLLGEDHWESVNGEAELAASLARSGQVDLAKKHFESSARRYGEIWGVGEEGHLLFSKKDWLLDWLGGDVGSARAKLSHYLMDKVMRDDLDAIYWTEMFGYLATTCMAQKDSACAREALDRGHRGAMSAPLHPWAYHINVVEAEYLFSTGDVARAKEVATTALRALEEKYPMRTEDIRRARAIIDT